MRPDEVPQAEGQGQITPSHPSSNDQGRRDVLLPCPFCGHAPVVQDSGALGGGWHVRCICTLAPGVCDRRREVAVELWNNRRPLPAGQRPSDGVLKRATLEVEPWGLDEVVSDGGIAHIERLGDRSFFANLPGIRLWFHSASAILVNYEMDILPDTDVEIRKDYEPDEDTPDPVEVARQAMRFVTHHDDCILPPGADARDHCKCGLNDWVDAFMALDRNGLGTGKAEVAPRMSRAGESPAGTPDSKVDARDADVSAAPVTHPALDPARGILAGFERVCGCGLTNGDFVELRADKERLDWLDREGAGRGWTVMTKEDGWNLQIISRGQYHSIRRAIDAVRKPRRHSNGDTK